MCWGAAENMPEESNARTTVTEYMDYATAHGVGRVKNSPYLLLKVFWVLAVLGSIVVVSIQLSRLADKWKSWVYVFFSITTFINALYSPVTSYWPGLFISLALSLILYTKWIRLVDAVGFTFTFCICICHNRYISKVFFLTIAWTGSFLILGVFVNDSFSFCRKYLISCRQYCVFGSFVRSFDTLRRKWILRNVMCGVRIENKWTPYILRRM